MNKEPLHNLLLGYKELAKTGPRYIEANSVIIGGLCIEMRREVIPNAVEDIN